jgi:hypothetical protein
MKHSHLIVEESWPVLLVEDNENRTAWFTERIPWLHVSVTSQEAIRRLAAISYKVVFLDHDLGFMDAADPTRLHGNGKEVARYLAAKKYQAIIVIHSLNPIGAEAMKKVLPSAHVLPFGTFDVEVKA